MNIINKTLFSAIIFASSQCVSSEYKLDFVEDIESTVVNNPSASNTNDAHIQEESELRRLASQVIDNFRPEEIERVKTLSIPELAEERCLTFMDAMRLHDAVMLIDADKANMTESINAAPAAAASSKIDSDDELAKGMADFRAFEAEVNAWARDNPEEFSALMAPLTAEELAQIEGEMGGYGAFASSSTASAANAGSNASPEVFDDYYNAKAASQSGDSVSGFGRFFEAYTLVDDYDVNYSVFIGQKKDEARNAAAAFRSRPSIEGARYTLGVIYELTESMRNYSFHYLAFQHLNDACAELRKYIESSQ